MSAHREFALHAVRGCAPEAHAGAKGARGPIGTMGIDGKANVPAG
jgi:hypothetical protein